MAVPKKGLKRPAAPADGNAVKKQCTAVVKALAQADLPYPVVETLKLVAPLALNTYADERHQHQVSLVGMIDEALKGIQVSLQQKVDDCQALVSNKDAEKGKREAAILTTGKALMASKIAAANKEYEVYEATQAFQKAAAALKETKKEQKAGDKSYIKLEETKTGFETLKAKVDEKKNTKCKSKECDEIKEELKSYGVDGSLVESLNLVLEKDPADRTEFDATIMTKLEDELLFTSKKLEKDLAEEEPGKKAREDKTAATQYAYDVANDKMTSLKEQMATASSKVTESQKDLSTAEESLKTYPSDMVAADSVLKEAEDKLEAFMATFGAFNELKERTTPPPPPPEPAEEVSAPVA